MSAAPTLALIGDVTVQAGAPLHIALDGFDADADALGYTVSVSGSNQLTGAVLQGDRSLRMTVAGFGDMVFELFEDQTPATTARIIQLAQAGFYDGLTFHRVVEDFMIQGGDPLGTGSGGSGVSFDDEFDPGLQFTGKGLLAMANSGDDTNDSQFFITSAAARYLDFNHSIFGFLTEGESVRQAVAAVDTERQDPNDSTSEVSKPVDDVVISSIDVFTDTENGTLVLTASEGTTGSADVTVTVNDGHGGTAQRTFHVTIVPDTANAPPFLLPIQDVHTKANTPVTFTIPGLDVEGQAGVEGNELFYASIISPANDALTIETSSTTGQTTITPSGNLAGVYGILVGVKEPTSSTWDTQSVPVFINPAAPSGIDLLESADTGVNSDNITSKNNNAAGNALSFHVQGVVVGAEVALFADGVKIGQATATETSVVIVTDGVATLTDGSHAITALQTLRNQPVDIGNRTDTVDLASTASSPLTIAIDTAGPAFTSSPVLGAAVGQQYRYDVQTDNETGATYNLVTSPAGMVIDSATGVITWTPQSGQGPSQAVVVRAVDAAGNQSQHSFSITLGEAPQLHPISDRTTAEGSLLTFTVTADATADPLTFGLYGSAPAGATIDAATGVFRWTPTEAQGPGSYEITIRATNLAGVSDYETFTVAVTEVNQSPALDAIADRTVAEGQLVDFTVHATDADLPANALTYSLGSGAPAGAVIDPTTGRFTFRPSELQGGASYPILVRVSDSAGASDQKSLTITVSEVDQPPMFQPVASQLVEPGDAWTLRLQAADLDQPPNAIVYSIEPGAPQGVTIEPSTGRITWNVPTDFPLGRIQLGVRATELASGGTGLSRVAVVEVVVHDTAELVNVAFEQLGAEIEAAPPVTLPDVLLLPLPGEQPVGRRLPGVSTATSATDLLGGSGLFGLQIGPDTGRGGGGPDVELPQNPSGAQPSSDAPSAEGGEKPDQPADKTKSPDHARSGSEQSDPRNQDDLRARDAALEELLQLV